MKTGAENRKKVVFAVVLMAAAIFLFARMVVGWRTEAAEPVVPSTPAPAQAAATAPRSTTASGKRAKTAPPLSLDPRLRLSLLAQSEQVQYKGTGRNIFDRESLPVIERPVASPIKTPPPQPVVQGPPPPPPINLKFFGFANSTGAPRQVFLAQGDDVFVAKEGDIVNRRYKVLRIMPNAVEIQDVLNNSRQTIPLTQG